LFPKGSSIGSVIARNSIVSSQCIRAHRSGKYSVRILLIPNVRPLLYRSPHNRNRNLTVLQRHILRERRTTMPLSVCAVQRLHTMYLRK
jgi:hypothetical protein